MKERKAKATFNGLQSAFARSRGARRPALVAYVTAGDPSLRFTEKLVLRLAKAGADVIELGVPFSDPIADGPVIQRASQRALRHGTRLADVLKLAARIRAKTPVPLVLFSYYNPVLQFGLERFASQAAAAGINGVLITDLTPEEAGEFVPIMRRRGLDTVFLAAPTSTSARLRQIARLSRGFVYLISRRGVTGPAYANPAAPRLRRLGASAGKAADALAEIKSMVGRLRRFTKLPIAVGFGIARPQQVAALNGVADGVVVGSALVECCERARGAKALQAADALVGKLKAGSVNR